MSDPNTKLQRDNATASTATLITGVPARWATMETNNAT